MFEVKVLGKDRFVVAHTSDTLMIGDLQTSKLSEIPWKSIPGSEEKFYFENETVRLFYFIFIIKFSPSDILIDLYVINILHTKPQYSH